MKMLQSGESIVTKDGQKVTPGDVQKITTPDIVEDKPLTYLFVDIPSVDYLPNLVSEAYLQSKHEGMPFFYYLVIVIAIVIIFDIISLNHILQNLLIFKGYSIFPHCQLYEIRSMHYG